MEIVSFIKALAPDLIELAVGLFHKSGGDVEVARRDIQDRRAEIDAYQEVTDRQLEEKHGSVDDDW